MIPSNEPEPSGRQRACEAMERSIGIRQIHSLSPDPEVWLFCRGLTKELLREMRNSKVARVMVMGAAELPEELNLSTVLSGKVRKASGRIRVSVHLTDAADNSLVWSEMYECPQGSAPMRQGEIARAISQAIPIDDKRVAVPPDDAGVKRN